MGLKSGFTLLETTIVVGIISLFLTVGSNLFVFSKQSARDAVRKTDIDQIRAALEFFREENPNRIYPLSLNELLANNGGYVEILPDDPLNNVYNYYYIRDVSDPTNYILGAKLERGGPSICGTNTACKSSSCNYCYSPFGLLITPTPTGSQPTQTPTNTPAVPTATPPLSTPTPTQVVPTPTATPTSTPTPTPVIVCNQIGKATESYVVRRREYYISGYNVTLGSNYSSSTWSILNNLNCSPLAGSGSTFNTKCTQLGTSTATVSIGTLQNTCQFSTIP